MTNRYIVAIACALLVVGLGSVARADADNTAAEREFRAGYRALQAGDCGDALAHYRRSLELAARPRTLFNIATCEEELGQTAAAWRDYQAFLAMAEERDAAIAMEARARVETLRKRLRGQVAIESTPPGASVSIDGDRQVRGETPVTIGVEPGRHLVRVSLPGAVAVERTVEIVPDQTAALRVELAMSSTISIRTDPADATIVPRDGGATAIGHLDAPARPGHYAFLIRRLGYRSEQVEIDAVAGRTHDVRVSLRPQPASSTLEVTGAAGARITIDGVPTAISLLRDVHELPLGTHDVVVEHRGRVVWRRGVSLSPGEVARLEVDLPRSRSRRREIIGWTAGGLGLGSIVLGGVFGTLGLRDVTSDRADVHDRGKTRALVADGLFVAGAAGLFAAWRLLRDDTGSSRLIREAP